MLNVYLLFFFIFSYSKLLSVHNLLGIIKINT